MKITLENALLTQSILSKNKASKEFDHLIDSKKETIKAREDDDNYWQHQNHLQQSELKFHAILSKAMHDEVFDKVNISSMTPTNTNPNITADKPILSMPTPTETSHVKSSVLSKYEIEQLIFWLKKDTIASENNAIREPLLPTKPQQKLRLHEVLFLNTPFKHHQLFINDHHVELTLNTTILDKQEALALQKLIKQWFKTKGYSLKKLIINGVIQ